MYLCSLQEFRKVRGKKSIRPIRFCAPEAMAGSTYVTNTHKKQMELSESKTEAQIHVRLENNLK